jgi:hypothetical protein
VVNEAFHETAPLKLISLLEPVLTKLRQGGTAKQIEQDDNCHDEAPFSPSEPNNDRRRTRGFVCAKATKGELPIAVQQHSNQLVSVSGAAVPELLTRYWLDHRARKKNRFCCRYAGIFFPSLPFLSSFNFPFLYARHTTQSAVVLRFLPFV